MDESTVDYDNDPLFIQVYWGEWTYSFRMSGPLDLWTVRLRTVPIDCNGHSPFFSLPL